MLDFDLAGKSLAAQYNGQGATVPITTLAGDSEITRLEPSL